MPHGTGTRKRCIQRRLMAQLIRFLPLVRWRGIRFHTDAHLLSVIPEGGVGLIDARLLLDGDARDCGSQDREGHGETVVVTWIDVNRIVRSLSLSELRVASHFDSSLQLFALDSTFFEFQHHRFNTIALLYPLVGDVHNPRGAVTHGGNGSESHEEIRHAVHVHISFNSLQNIRRLWPGNRRCSVRLFHLTAHFAQKLAEIGITLNARTPTVRHCHCSSGDGSQGQRVRG
mmetsp:Transcript_358/g.521  ORF Transcript_358/g.521 Transcript_358/m.521 type:complete len:230 (+) Transcript_358:144-833(+)